MIDDKFDSRTFYELMQEYRHSRDNGETVVAFEAVKAFARAVVEGGNPLDPVWDKKVLDDPH